MGKNSADSEKTSPVNNNNGDLEFKSIRDRFLFKRNSLNPVKDDEEERDRKSDRQLRARSHQYRGGRKGFLSKGTYLFYFVVIFAIVAFVVASVVLQTSMTSIFRPGRERGKSFREGLKFGGSLRFAPFRLWRRFVKQGELDRFRMEAKVALRPPKLAIVLGNMEKDPSSLMLFTVLKSLHRLGYEFKVFAVEGGKARSSWEQIGSRISILNPSTTGEVDWSIFEGIVVYSLGGKNAISRILFVRYR